MKYALATLTMLIVLLVTVSLWFPKKPAELPEIEFDWKPILRTFPTTALHSRGTTRQDRCLNIYSSIYERDEVDFRILFGYKDARPARFVGDRYEKMAFVNYLLLPCSRDFHACGFTRDSEDADLLIKTIVGPNRRLKKIKLLVPHSSVSPDDNLNRGDSFQRWQSEYARQKFVEGLGKADVVLYVGHSRDGGGPDFDPPRLLLNQHTDYGWYRKHSPGLTLVRDTLAKAPIPPKLFGLYSCASTQHFTKEISSVAPSMALITSPKLLYYLDAMKNLMGTLSALLGMWCQDDFHYVLRTQEQLSELIGFFER